MGQLDESERAKYIAKSLKIENYFLSCKNNNNIEIECIQASLYIPHACHQVATVHKAAQVGDISIVAAFLDKGGNPNAKCKIVSKWETLSTASKLNYQFSFVCFVFYTYQLVSTAAAVRFLVSGDNQPIMLYPRNKPSVLYYTFRSHAALPARSSPARPQRVTQRL